MPWTSNPPGASSTPYPDQTFSFGDCTTFAIMERIGIDEAFAFDPTFWCSGTAGPGSARADDFLSKRTGSTNDAANFVCT